MYNYDDRQLNFAGVANGSIISFTCTANNRPNNISIRTALTVLESTGWFGSSEGYDSGDYWYPTAGTGPKTLTITYDNTKTYYIDTLTAPSTLLPPNDESDYWEVNISCAGPTPTPTTAPLYGYFRSTNRTLTSEFCVNPGFITSAQWYSTGSTLSTAIGYNIVYSDTNYTVFNGSSLWYAVSSDNTFNTYTGGQFNAVQIDSNGSIISTSLINCSSGGGGGGGLT